MQLIYYVSWNMLLLFHFSDWCSFILMSIYVTVGLDKPLARLKVVRRLSVDKGQVLRSGILDTSFSLCVLPLKDGLTQKLK